MEEEEGRNFLTPEGAANWIVSECGGAKESAVIRQMLALPIYEVVIDGEVVGTIDPSLDGTPGSWTAYLKKGK